MFKNGRKKTGGRKKGTKNKKRKITIHQNKNFDLLNPKWEKKEVVYFIKCLGTDFCKIGISFNVYNRIMGIDSSCPHKIVVLDIFEFGDYKQVEKILHNSLSFFKIKGEWFSLTEEIQKEVCKIKDYNDLMEFKGNHSNTLF